MFRLPSGAKFRDNHAVAAKLGEILLSVGAISPAALNRALLSQRSTGGRLGTVLLEQGLVTEETLARALAKSSGREYAYWNMLQNVPREVIALVPAKLATRCQAVPFAREGRILKVAMRDPNDLAAGDELAFVTGRKIDTYVISEVRIAEALEKYYGERRLARFRAVSDRLARPHPVSPVAPVPVVPPPPPPSPYRAVAETPAPAASLRPPLAGGSPPAGAPPEPFPTGRSGEIWKTSTPSASDAEDIDIDTWRPAVEPAESVLTPVAFVPPSSRPPESLEVEYTPESSQTPVVPATPLPPPPPMSFEEATAQMLAAESRHDIADAVLSHLQSGFERIALFIARQDDVIGWDARGDGISRTSFKAIRIPFSQPSVFLNSKLSGGYYQGPLPALPSHDGLIEALGHRPRECALVPVAIKKRVIAFLYVEPQGATVPPEKIGELRQMASVMADAFALLALKIKRMRTPLDRAKSLD